MTTEERIIDILSTVEREGMDDLLKYLKTSSFFEGQPWKVGLWDIQVW